MPSNTDLKKFAQTARRQLLEQVAIRLEQVLKTDSSELREKEQAIRELKQQIAQTSKKAVIDRVAYTWFNRLCALRFMDVNRYNRISVVSPVEGFTQPEILQEAKQGLIDEDLGNFVNRQVIFELLNGQRPSKEPQQEAYRLLLVGVCNANNAVMPFMFEKIADYTELLMPLDLLSDTSVLSGLREAVTPEACQDVEVIGWLYQYYISERKDEVFEGLKQNKKIEAEDIPAATQRFTPHWIVSYLVENSLGRLWMLNKPASRLVDKMDYYIKPVQEESDYLKINSVEEIKLCDLACGSGHMLTYGFDLLYAIYEEEGYTQTEIPGLILKKNLYGIEIDERAGALAAFALFMKARSKDRRFFSHPTQPNICVLENISFTDQELNEYMSVVGRDLFSEPLRETLKQFEQANNFGSLIRPILTDAAYIQQVLAQKNLGGNLFLYAIHERVQKALLQIEYLSPRYHVVVTNPPYMGGGGMNDEIKEFAKDFYPDSKSDLFAAFIERNLDLALKRGLIGMITMQSWMFLSSYEKLREKLLKQNTVLSMAHLGAKAFDSIGGEIVSTTAFILENVYDPNVKGVFCRLVDEGNEAEKASAMKEAIRNPDCGWFYSASTADFKKIQGTPIAYWVSDTFRNIFEICTPLSLVMEPRKGIATGDNDKFLRLWFEVETSKTVFPKDVGIRMGKWYATTKGGVFRKWYGNHDYLVNWQNDGYEIKNFRNSDGSLKSRPQNIGYFFREGITWSDISSSQNAFRKFPKGFAFEGRGPSGFLKNNISFEPILGFLNSKIVSYSIQIINPTLSLNVGEISRLPFFQKIVGVTDLKTIVSKCILISISDWDSYETSWDFTILPLIGLASKGKTLSQTYESLHTNWQMITKEMQQLEVENNHIFIRAYGLQDELIPEVPLEEITLTCNPSYRYSNNRSSEELETLLCTDTMKEFINYAVGCMFGRYSLDKPGLILANQGETLQDYLHQIPQPSFTPDEDNAIPILDGDWFSDDITARFKQFLRITFGDEHYDENLKFIENAIGRDIRSYFLKEFYTYHIKMYQKRPIYWLFSSPKGSFNILIYMHRYKADTLSVVLRYLRDFVAKLEAHKSHQEQVSISASASQREKTAALKEIESLKKTLEELKVYERDVLFPLAAQRIEIDLDDGVKLNYAKFGKALVMITGLD